MYVYIIVNYWMLLVRASNEEKYCMRFNTELLWYYHVVYRISVIDGEIMGNYSITTQLVQYCKTGSLGTMFQGSVLFMVFLYSHS